MYEAYKPFLYWHFIQKLKPLPPKKQGNETETPCISYCAVASVLLFTFIACKKQKSSQELSPQDGKMALQASSESMQRKKLPNRDVFDGAMISNDEALPAIGFQKVYVLFQAILPTQPPR